MKLTMHNRRTGIAKKIEILKRVIVLAKGQWSHADFLDVYFNLLRRTTL